MAVLLFLPPPLYRESLTTCLREIRNNLRLIVLASTGLAILTAAGRGGRAVAPDRPGGRPG